MEVFQLLFSEHWFFFLKYSDMTYWFWTHVCSNFLLQDMDPQDDSRDTHFPILVYNPFFIFQKSIEDLDCMKLVCSVQNMNGHCTWLIAISLDINSSKQGLM